MFIQVGTQVKVEDLLKGMIVQSGNDACVALAEAIAGDEENFAQMMNREAQRLGMKGSSFRNSSGLPDPQHYTTARDLATGRRPDSRFPRGVRQVLLAEGVSLQQHHAAESQPFAVDIDPTVDGLKTGYTEAAGYCLVSSAKRGPRRLVSVVLGAASDNAYASRSRSSCSTTASSSTTRCSSMPRTRRCPRLKVWKGTGSHGQARFTDDLVIVVPKGFGPKIQTELVCWRR
jgi:D-alanyl-D-alanine carboxypeptidase (penicillin-binding protein 5/6)